MNRWLKRGLILAAVVGVGAVAMTAFNRAKQEKAEAPKFRTQAMDRGAITQAARCSPSRP
jgi:uncharacterized membrane protein YebE (DUF533 family)